MVTPEIHKRLTGFSLREEICNYIYHVPVLVQRFKERAHLLYLRSNYVPVGSRLDVEVGGNTEPNSVQKLKNL